MLKPLLPSELNLIWHIFEESFPTDERRPYDEELALLLRDDFKIYVCRDENSKIMGFISIYELSDFIFAEHFAIDEKYRNRGLGSKILKELTESTKKPVCLEVEPPICDIARRRIEFYKRCGFHLNDYYYIQPPLSKGQGEVELRLMTTQRPISEAEFLKIRDIIYRDIYRV